MPLLACKFDPFWNEWNVIRRSLEVSCSLRLRPRCKNIPSKHNVTKQRLLTHSLRNCALSGKSITYGKSRTRGSDKQTDYVLCNKDVRAQNIPKCRFF